MDENPSIQKREWNVESLDSYRTNNHKEKNNHRINCTSFRKSMNIYESNDERTNMSDKIVISI